MKTTMPEIAANEALRRRLCGEILAGKLSHAYIIEGAEGTGRHLLAKNIAKAAACENRTVDGLPLPCNVCESCRKIEKGISPDVIYIRREDDKASVGVEMARFIRTDVYTLPNDLDIKVYIVEEADKLTPQAQNALLLTLEEPPSYSIFLLLCEQSGMLLETVRSRAPTLRTEPVSSELMAEFLCDKSRSAHVDTATQLKSRSPEEFAEIITASGGGIGRAYTLLDPEKRILVLENRKQVRRFVSSVIKNKSGAELFDAISAFSQKRDELAEQLDLVSLAIRDLVVLKKYEAAELCFYSDREAALELSSEKPAAMLFRFGEACEKAAQSIRRNANIRLTMTELSSLN